MEVNLDKLKEGDQLVLLAKVVRNRPGNFKAEVNELSVSFKNGDKLPLGSVDIIDIKQYAVKKGDRVYVKSDEKPLRDCEVIALLTDIEPPQAVYRRVGEWPTHTCKIEDMRRI